MSPSLIVKLIIAAAGFGAAWQIQSWRMDAQEKDYAQQQLADQRSAATAAIRRQETVITAVSAGAVREVALRRDAAGARTALVGLHAAADQALRDAATTHAACTNTAAALSDVLQQSAERYRDLGETCDRHVNDLRTLSEAWPK